jgi:hypothetical protein
MDRKKIVGEVAARHGIRLDEDDPAMVMATIAEIAFRDAQAQLAGAIRAETAEFARVSGEVQEKAGAQLGVALREAMKRIDGPKRDFGWFVIAATGLVAAGFLIGWWMAK